jgi:PmbA protein
VSANHLAELAAETVKQALARGATDAECTISEGSEFSANVRMREVENLKEAGSRGAGLRILIGRHTGASYTSDLSQEGIAHLVKSAIELADITTEDPHAGLPDADEFGTDLTYSGPGYIIELEFSPELKLLCFGFLRNVAG